MVLGTDGNSIKLNSEGISLESASDIKIVASGGLQLESGGALELAAGSELKGEAASGVEISSGAITKLSGSMVEIN